MANFFDHDVAQATGDATAADKLLFSAPFPCFIVRWGVLARAAITGGTMDATLDIIPKGGGTRVNGSVSGGFDVAGGSMTDFNVPVGTAVYHEPKHDVRGIVSPGTGVKSRGGQLRLEPGDTAVVEVTGAGTGGAGSVYFIEYGADDAFNAAKDTGYVKINS